MGTGFGFWKGLVVFVWSGCGDLGLKLKSLLAKAKYDGICRKDRVLGDFLRSGIKSLIFIWNLFNRG